MTRFLSLQTARLSNLVTIYSTYFNVLRESSKKWEQIQLNTPQPAPKLTLQRALVAHIIRILFVRLHAVASTGSILAIFQSKWDPIILEILTEGELIGCCFIERQSKEVFQINVIAKIAPKQETWMEHDVMAVVKEYLKRLGATRIIVRSNVEEMKNFLKMCGYTSIFSDSILYCDL